MPVYELILSSDTINEGRIKINNAFSATTGLWSGSTGVQSLIHNNGSGNIAEGDYSIVAGSANTIYNSTNEASAIIGGINNEINSTLYDAEFGGNISTIIGGYLNESNALGSNIIGSYYTSISGDSTSWYGNTVIGNLDLDAGFYHINGIPYSGAVISNSRLCIVAGGANNRIKIACQNSAVIGGEGNEITRSSNAFINGGSNNELSEAYQSFVLGGWNNSVSNSTRGSILGSNSSSIISNQYSTKIIDCNILGGEFNEIKFTGSTYYTENSTIIGGSFNSIYNFSTPALDGRVNESTILGGYKNELIGFFGFNGGLSCSIIGGQYNQIGAANNSVILGGYRNVLANLNRNNNIVAGTGVAPRSGNTFTMGYGGSTPGSASNANCTIALEFTDGSLYYNGGLFPGAADYAEFFEWNDGNLSNEDRTGYFVSLIGEKIEIGNSDVIGVISASPAVAGDSASLVWNGQFLTDEFGRIEKEKYSVYIIEIEKEEIEVEETRTMREEKVENIKIVKETKEIYIDSKNNIYSEQPYTTNMIGVLYDGDTSNKKFIREEYLNKINPSFDANQTYVPREKRPEWSPVGLLGKLYVRTSEAITGNKISVDANGMAINGTDYHVLKETKAYDGNYGIVQILFK